MNTAITITSKILIKGIIETQTGLHIGGNSVSMGIGGVDNVIVRNPLDNRPYIPGSSIRGKMRALLERFRGNEMNNPEGGFSESEDKDNNNKQIFLAGKDNKTLLGKLFGTASDKDNNDGRTSTRLIVRDATLNSESNDKLENAPNLDMPLSEVKTEVAIDRITASANPRQVERVPRDVSFDFELILTLLSSDSDDDRKAFFNLIGEGMMLIQDDYLGGHGSRGYGQIQFYIDSIVERTCQYYSKNAKEIPLTECFLFKKFPKKS